jgi:hypothetical protein
MGSEARLVSEANIREVAAWCGGMMVEEIDPFDDAVTNPAFNVQTIKEIERAHIGDTLIKNHNGTFQLWKAE